MKTFILYLPKILKIFVSLCKECWVSFHLYLSFDPHMNWFLFLFWILFFISITWNFFIILKFLLVLFCFPIYKNLRFDMILNIDLPPPSFKCFPNIFSTSVHLSPSQVKQKTIELVFAAIPPSTQSKVVPNTSGKIWFARLIFLLSWQCVWIYPL